MMRHTLALRTRHVLAALAFAGVATALEATALAQVPEGGCAELPAEPTDLGDPTGFRIVLRTPGDVTADPCHPIRAEKARRLSLVRAWREGDPVPVGFHPENKPRLGMVRGGAIAAGLAYTVSLVMGVALANNGYYAAVPLAGPFVAAATYQRKQLDCNAGVGCLGQAVSQSMSDTLVRGVLIANGVAQLAGTAVLVGGLAGRRWTLRPDEGPRVMPVPMIGVNGGGVGVVGRF